MPQLIDFIDAAIFLSPLAIATIVLARFTLLRFAH
jgi:hypothetical protein